MFLSKTLFVHRFGESFSSDLLRRSSEVRMLGIPTSAIPKFCSYCFEQGHRDIECLRKAKDDQEVRKQKRKQEREHNKEDTRVRQQEQKTAVSKEESNSYHPCAIHGRERHILKLERLVDDEAQFAETLGMKQLWRCKPSSVCESIMKFKQPRFQSLKAHQVRWETKDDSSLFGL